MKVVPIEVRSELLPRVTRGKIVMPTVNVEGNRLAREKSSSEGRVVPDGRDIPGGRREYIEFMCTIVRGDLRKYSSSKWIECSFSVLRREQ